MHPLSKTASSSDTRVGSSFFVPSPSEITPASYFLVEEDEIDSPSMEAPAALAGPKVVGKPTAVISSLNGSDDWLDTGSASAAEGPDSSSKATREDENTNRSSVAVPRASGATSRSRSSRRPNSPGLCAVSLGESTHGSGASYSISLSEYPSSLSHSAPGNRRRCLDEARTDSVSDQQLIMPVIAMPTRGAFTEAGKRIGGLKILVAGRRGGHLIMS